MGNADEVPPSRAAQPIPPHDGENGPVPDRAAPTAAAVLGWIANAAGQPWFPARQAAESNIDRDTLDEPLGLLRRLGFVRIDTWVRGLGQGYVLTAEGESILASGAVIPEEEPTRPPDVAPRPDDSETEDRHANVLALDARPSRVVPILLAANLLWFGTGLVVALRNGLSVWQYLSEGNNEVLHRIGAVAGFDFLEGQWWRLLTSCFVHIGTVHLLFNMFALVMIGPLAELLWGRWRLLIIYLLSGMAGSCLAMALKPDSLLAGASGAIWGLLLSLVAWFMLFRAYLPTDVLIDSTRRLVMVILLNGLFSFLPGVSWQAHLGGGLAGFVTAWLLNAMRFGERPRRIFALVTLVALVLGSGAALLAAMKWGDAWIAYRHRVEREQQRLAEDHWRREILELSAAYNRDVIPLLNRLSPDRVRPVEELAVNQLIRAGQRRNTARVADARAKLGELKAAAESAAELLSGPPTGSEPIDQHRARVRSFAEARARSFSLLLQFLDSPAIPDDGMWTAWGSARRTADQMWTQSQWN